MKKSFAAEVGNWAKGAEDKLRDTRNRAIELLANDMRKTVRQGGRVPFQTGNLARSLRASSKAMPTSREGPFESQDIGIITATLPLNKRLWIGYQANYARRMNYGFVGQDSLGRSYNQAGYYFVEHAVSNWQK